jgi:hypothetical protein
VTPRLAGAARGTVRGVAWRSGVALLLVAANAGVPRAVAAQRPPDEPVHHVDGRVVRGTRAGQEPVPNVWVVLHRVGSDRAGPLDSARTSARGTYGFRYRPFGDSAAIYFVSASYGGIAYFTPLRGPVVSGDDAIITVFDTTSAPIPITLGGRHVIIGAPQPNGRRPIGEVYDLQNDTTVTLVARDSTPLWSTHLPARAEQFQLNASADIAPAAVTRRDSTVGLFAPLSPGVRQFAFTYELPRSAFPIDIRAERTTGVLEVLVQEPTAKVQGAQLQEVAPVTAEGRSFRRFLAKDVPAGASFRVDVPRTIGAERTTVTFGVAAVMVAAMLAALGVAMRRRVPRLQYVPAAPVVSRRESEVVLQSLAALDAEFERTPEHSDDARSAYESRRAVLKEQLARALAGEHRRA